MNPDQRYNRSEKGRTRDQRRNATVERVMWRTMYDQRRRSAAREGAARA